MKMTAVLLCGNGFLPLSSPRQASFFHRSFGSDPCFPAPAHDQYLSCGSLRHAVRYFRRFYHIGDQEYHRLRFAPRFPRLDDRRLPVGIPVQPHEKTLGSRPWRIHRHIAHRRPCLLSGGRSLYGVVKRSFFLYFSLLRFLRRRVPHCFHRPQRDPYLSNKYDKRKIIFLLKLTFRGLQASFFLHKNDGCTLIIYDLYVQLTSGVKTIDSFYFHQI